MSSSRDSRTTFVTERQAVVHALFMKHRSMSVVARMMDVSSITVRETLVQYQRNVLRDQGIRPPSLKKMLRGDVSGRFGITKSEAGGRPAKHRQVDPTVPSKPKPAPPVQPRERRSIDISTGRALHFIVTAVEAGKRVHTGFWRNLLAYGDHLGAEIMVMRIGGHEPVRGEREHPEIEAHTLRFGVDIGLEVDIAADVRLQAGGTRPLSSTQGRASAVWTIFRHPAIQLETLARIRADGLRVQMTSGAITVRRRSSESGAGDVGAVIVEVGADGIAHCRHILAAADGDGSFQDLSTRVVHGKIRHGCPVEALNFGDVHRAWIDQAVVDATWGRLGGVGLVDRLRPARQIFHDICDFAARSPFQSRDQLKRFAQHSVGQGSVREEFFQVADFLSGTCRPWSESVVVHSNHDEMLVRWLREADFRDDPTNAVFFLEYSLALHRRLERGEETDGFFEHVLRDLSPDDLAGVRFLADGESLKVAGVESGIHGHKGPDGRIGGMQALERLGIRATIGHTHRPTTRDQLCSAGVCQTEMAYAKGPLTAWAVGHVVTYWNGARQHLLFHGGRFHAELDG